MAAAALLAAGALASANATEVHYPKANPKVSVNVPDGWSVAYTDVGLELRAPASDSIVVATIVKRSKDAVDAWRQKALTKLEADGVSIGGKPPAAAKTADAKPTPSQPSEAAQADRKVEPKSDPAQQLPGDASRPTFAFAGSPSLATPNVTGQPMPFDMVGATSPSKGGEAQPAGKSSAKKASEAKVNGLPVQSVRLTGGTFKDKPTDIQLVFFKLPNNEFFLVEQQSSPDDNRAADILMSTKLRRQ